MMHDIGTGTGTRMGAHAGRTPYARNDMVSHMHNDRTSVGLYHELSCV